MKIPFRMAILAATVGLLVITAASLIAYAVVQSRRTIAVLKQTYLAAVAEAAAGEVARLPRRAEDLLLAHRALAEANRLTIEQPVTLGRLFARVLTDVPEFAWLSYGDDASGQFAGANRIDADLVVINVSDPRRRGGVPREYRVTANGALVPFTRTPPVTAVYDPRPRAWYRQAVATPERIVWLPPYRFSEGVMGVTAALAVRGGPARSVRGVLTADFSLVGIDRFLRTLRVRERGVVLLFTTDGELLAGPPGPGREAVRRAVPDWSMARDSPDRLAPRPSETMVDGAAYDVVARPVNPDTSLNWTVVVSVPEDDFLGVVYAQRRTAMLIALAGVLLAAGVGILLSTGMANSLGTVTGELDRLARFVLGTTLGARSRMKEIAQLQEAVGRMTASLRSFTRYAPEDIVREVVVSGREAMLSGENREVSLLFSDLRGFTGLAERRRPEEVVAILNDHFDLLSGLVVEHGGYVVDFLGDSLFAVFGAPRVATDHAEQAVTCAIEMQRARQTQNERHRDRGWPPLEIGVGVNTGVAVVGNMGSHLRIKYGVVGHSVNLAARIESFTVAGQVLVSDATRQAVGARLGLEGPLEVEGKGVGPRIRVWLVRRLEGPVPLELPSPTGSLAALHTPLRAEMRVLQGKQIGAENHSVQIVRLGATGAEIRTRVDVPTLGSMQLTLGWPDGGSRRLGGRVIGRAGEGTADRTLLVRFEGLDWETRARLESLVADPSAVAASRSTS